MALIFAGSTDLLSTRHTSRFIGPFLRWLNPNVSVQTVESIQLFIRKCGHLSEYAVLALLFWRARRKPVKHDVRPWSQREAALAVLFCLLYAATDEFHQSFIASRYASVADVGFDTLGATLGITLLWYLGRWKKEW